MKRFLALLLVCVLMLCSVTTALADAIADGNFNATGLPILNEVKTYTIAIHAKCCHRVKETCCQTTKTTITKRWF